MGSTGKLPTAHASPERFQRILTGPHQKVKILVLGGTKFLGRATVERRSSGVTTSRSSTAARPTRSSSRSRRSAATGRRPSPLEVAVGTPPFPPATSHVVRRSTEALEGSVGRYLFVSSVSVYSDSAKARARTRPGPSSATLLDEMLPEYENYGALKALCEDAVWEVYGDRATIVRPGLIVGPHDPTGRFVLAAPGCARRRDGRARATRAHRPVRRRPRSRPLAGRAAGAGRGRRVQRDSLGCLVAGLIDSARSVAARTPTPVWILTTS